MSSATVQPLQPRGHGARAGPGLATGLWPELLSAASATSIPASSSNGPTRVTSSFMLHEPALTFLSTRSRRPEGLLHPEHNGHPGREDVSAERICSYSKLRTFNASNTCCGELFDAGPYVERMLAKIAGFEFAADVPRCPHCGWLAPWVARRYVSAGCGIAPRALDGTGVLCANGNGRVLLLLELRWAR